MQITEYLQDVQAELKHVKWPSRKTTLAYTVVVVVLSLVTAAYLGAFDWLFSNLITSLI